jgi:hypothetical protein
VNLNLVSHDIILFDNLLDLDVMHPINHHMKFVLYQGNILLLGELAIIEIITANRTMLEVTRTSCAEFAPFDTNNIVPVIYPLQ